MELLLYLAASALVLFMILATYDGLYLHIWKFALFSREESKFEHKTHAIRALLFPLIVWFLFIENTSLAVFTMAMAFVVLDLVVLGVDAYSEKESRKFMGGLPKWEYIVHLFANGFHFAAIILGITLKWQILDGQWIFIEHLAASPALDLLSFISINVIPGAVALAVLHLVLMFAKPQLLWHKYRAKVTCC